MVFFAWWFLYGAMLWFFMMVSKTFFNDTRPIVGVFPGIGCRTQNKRSNHGRNGKNLKEHPFEFDVL